MVKVIGDFVEVQGKHEEKKVGILGGGLFTVVMICVVSSKIVFICSARRTVRGLQRGSLTAATESQRECTPWLWSQRCLQMASLSYLHPWCRLRT